MYTRPTPIQINSDVVVSIQRYLHFTSNSVLFSSFHNYNHSLYNWFFLEIKRWNRRQREFVNKSFKPCGEGINLDKHIDCLKEDFVERLNKTTFQCLSFYEYNIMRKKFPNIPVCNASLAHKSHELFIEVIESYRGVLKQKLKCKKPCIVEDVTYNSAFSKSTGI